MPQGLPDAVRLAIHSQISSDDRPCLPLLRPVSVEVEGTRGALATIV